ncbi:MAG: DUF2298 domain-containing protein [Patescibacteria group bacterium]
MINSLFIALQWYSMLLLLGLIFFPFTKRLFAQFIDGGYAFSKTVGILIVAYLMLVTGTVHILTFTFPSLIILILVSAGLSFFSFRYFPLPDKSHRLLPWIIAEELLFLTVFLFWAYVRSFTPDINGLEKFMDYGFVNSILKTTYFPAKDMWFTPFSINYYYFGHFVTALLTKLSLLSSNYTYNLMIASIAALTFSSSFSIAINLYNNVAKKKYFLRLFIVGILTAAIVTFAGNFHSIYTFFKPYENEHPVPPLQLQFSPLTFPNSYWYPNATRFIYHTIHEFPIYSWTVSDLHGHVTDIPFVLLTLSFLFSVFLGGPEKKVALKLSNKGSLIREYYLKLNATLPVSLFHLLSISLLLAVMYMTNAWDGLIYLLMTGLLLTYLEWDKISDAKISIFPKLMTVILELVVPCLILGLGFVIFSIPFSLFFKPFVSGIGLLCAPGFLTNMKHLGPLLFEPNHCQKSPLWQLVILYGFFYVFVLFLLVGLSRVKKWQKADIYVILLIILGTILIIVPEFLYAKDIYPEHYRANTMFKLVFQSFIMLSLVSGYSISRVSLLLKSGKARVYKILYPFFFVITLLCLTVVFVYPYFAIMSYYGNLTSFKGLDGTAYLKDRFPEDAKAITWLNTHVTGQPVILEAQGDSYTDYARVSSNTGLPTVLGWTVHEWLWRGTYDIPAPRIQEVKDMYESDDNQKTQSLLDKYDVHYVFIGTLEREKYTVNEEKFNALAKIVFRSGNTAIYKLN